MNFKDIQDFLLANVRNHSTENISVVKQIILASVNIVAGQKERPQLRISDTLSTVTNQYDDYVLSNQEFADITRFTVTGYSHPLAILPHNIMIERFSVPSDWGVGPPEFLSIVKIAPHKAVPTSSSVLAVVSNAAGDTSQNVRIVGISSGYRKQEDVSLNGTTPANTSASFTDIMSIEKDARTTGAVTITSNSGAVEINEIPPDSLSSQYIWLRIHPIPDGVYTVNLFGQRRIHPMVDDTDVPGDFWDAKFQEAVLGVALGLLTNDQKLANAAAMADKVNGTVKGTLGMRTWDRRAYRRGFEHHGRYLGQ